MEAVSTTAPAPYEEEHTRFLDSYQDLMEGLAEEFTLTLNRSSNRGGTRRESRLSLSQRSGGASQDGEERSQRQVMLESPPTRRRIMDQSPSQSPQRLRSSNISSTQGSLSFLSQQHESLKISQHQHDRLSHDVDSMITLSHHSEQAEQVGVTDPFQTCPPSPINVVGDDDEKQPVRSYQFLGLEASEVDDEPGVDAGSRCERLHRCSQTQIECSQTQVDDDQLRQHADEQIENDSQASNHNVGHFPVAVSPSKKSRMETSLPFDANHSSQNLLESGTETSSLFSSRWMGHSSFSQDASKIETTEGSLSDEGTWANDCDGWDVKWSSTGESLIPSCASFLNEREGNSLLTLFTHAEQSLREEEVESNSIQATIASLMTSASRGISLSNAPGLERLKRRVLHRPSQETTQTIAAPVSALDWIRRTQPKEISHSLNESRFGQAVRGSAEVISSIGVELAKHCRELNAAERVSNDPKPSFDLQQEFASFKRMYGAEDIQLRLVQAVPGSCVASVDCLDMIAIVGDRTRSAEIVNDIRSTQEHVGSFDFSATSLPLFHRVAGPFKASSSARFVVLDLKIVPTGSSWLWAIEAFYSKPRAQVNDIVLFAATQAHGISQPKSQKLQQGETGLGDFLNAVHILAKDGPIMDWTSLLKAYHSASE